MKTFEEFWENATIPNKLSISKIHAEHFWNAATEAAKPRWIPVTERLPDKDDKYLIKADDYAVFQAAWFNPCSGLFDVCHLDISSKEVTHWMAVPE